MTSRSSVAVRWESHYTLLYLYCIKAWSQGAVCRTLMGHSHDRCPLPHQHEIFRPEKQASDMQFNQTVSGDHVYTDQLLDPCTRRQSRLPVVQYQAPHVPTDLICAELRYHAAAVPGSADSLIHNVSWTKIRRQHTNIYNSAFYPSG